MEKEGLPRTANEDDEGGGRDEDICICIFVFIQQKSA